MSWISRLFGKTKTTSPPPIAERVVPDQEYQFKMGTTPVLPEGLQNLKITEVRHDLLILENFEIDLTVDQSYIDKSPGAIASASRCLRWAKSYHKLNEAPQPPVRLHHKNVLITASHYRNQHDMEADLLPWLDHFGWNTNRSVHVQQATTDKPLEDGYFSCLRLGTDLGGEEASTPRNWSEPSRTTDVVGRLVAFVQDELERVGRDHSCERFLQESYDSVPKNELTHPVFAFLDFPIFDMGTVQVTFSGSVWSENEIRLWSRPTYYHK